MDALVQRGVTVTAMSRNRARHSDDNAALKYVYGDLEVAETLAPVCQDVDTVFHLAGHAHAHRSTGRPDDGVHEAVNAHGTKALVNAAGQQGVKSFVFFSSIKVMGEGGETQLDESCTCEPETPYARAKLAAEQEVLSAGAQYNMHVCNLRLSLVYGPGVKGNLAQMIAAIDRGTFPPLPVLGNKRSMVHVLDVVQTALLAVEQPEANGQTYIVTDDHAYSTSEICLGISRALGKSDRGWSVPMSALRAIAKVGDAIGWVRGKRFVFDSDSLEKLTGSAWYSPAKIQRALGFKPRHTFQDALPEMIAAYRQGSNDSR